MIIICIFYSSCYYLLLVLTLLLLLFCYPKAPFPGPRPTPLPRPHRQAQSQGLRPHHQAPAPPAGPGPQTPSPGPIGYFRNFLFLKLHFIICVFTVLSLVVCFCFVFWLGIFVVLTQICVLIIFAIPRSLYLHFFCTIFLILFFSLSSFP